MKTLNIKIVSYLLVFSLLFTTSCETIRNSNNAQKGGAVGGAVGAAAGALIAENSALGALIGAAVGGGAGAIIGNQMDKQAREIKNTIPGAQVERSEEGIQVILDEQSEIRFDFDKSSLTDSAKLNLNKFVTIFNKYPDTNILIVGYTDSKGSEEYNKKLSERRAESVAQYLISNGIAASRLTSKGMGEEEPKASNDTEEGRAENRRVEFAITANDKMINDAKVKAGENDTNQTDSGQ